MGERVVLALRGVIGVALLGSAAVQGAVASSPWWDDDSPNWSAVAAAAIVVVGIAMLQVVAVCTWRLLTFVRRGTVFSRASFPLVDAMIIAIAVASALTFALAVVARFANHGVPEDEVAPGVVALLCGASLVIAGVALLVHVMRTLLAQAVALDAEATSLRSELDEVI